jgi:hypothetical protein
MRLRIDYYDQNSEFEKLLPKSGTVERIIPATDSALTWYLFRLDEVLQYEDSTIDRFIIASRWQDKPVGVADPTSVFVLSVPLGTEVGQSFSTTQYSHVVWGMANSISTKSQNL